MKLKNIKTTRCIKEIYEVEFVDGTKGIIEIEPFKIIPIIDGKMCQGCRNGRNGRHCLYFKIGLVSDECPKNVIRRIDE